MLINNLLYKYDIFKYALVIQTKIPYTRVSINQGSINK